MGHTKIIHNKYKSSQVLEKFRDSPGVSIFRQQVKTLLVVNKTSHSTSEGLYEVEQYAVSDSHQVQSCVID